MSFDALAKQTAIQAGRPWAFGLAVAVVVVWAVSGPIFGYSDTWQLVINTGTTVATFLMVFLIQNSQNRGTEALQVKLDALILATEGARNQLVETEELATEELAEVKSDIVEAAER